MTSAYDVFQFVSEHIHIIGWTGLGVLAWKARGSIDEFITSMKTANQEVSSTHDLTAQVKAGVDTMQTNHLVHLQQTAEESKDILSSIDKNMAILVDRSK
jgi:hypothetical protein